MKAFLLCASAHSTVVAMAAAQSSTARLYFILGGVLDHKERKLRDTVKRKRVRILL
jgi:hypothetical protein